MNVNAIGQIYIDPSVIMRAVHDCASERAPKRTAESLKWRNEVYEWLSNAEMSDMAEQFIECSDPPVFKTRKTDPELPTNAKTVYYCPACGTGKVYMETCHLRICPECAHRLAARLVARYAPVLTDLAASGHPSYSVRKIELTTPYHLMDGAFSVFETHELNVDEPRARLRDMFAAALRVFDTLLRPGWRMSQALAIAAEYGPRGDKLHFHILHYGEFIPKRKLTEVWQAETGGVCQINWIKRVPDDNVQASVSETFKYVVKFWKQKKDGTVIRVKAEIVPTLAKVLKGQRRVRTYGLLYGVPEPEPEPLRCSVCGMELVRWTPIEWDVYCKTGWTPAEYDAARAGLDLRPGNNFAGRDPPENKNAPSYRQTTLPGIEASMDYIH